MESQLQNPESRINPENFHPCGLISCPSVLASLTACIFSSQQDSWSVLPCEMLWSSVLKLAAAE